jgi:hypothetical protein
MVWLGIRFEDTVLALNFGQTYLLFTLAFAILFKSFSNWAVRALPLGRCFFPSPPFLTTLFSP